MRWCGLIRRPAPSVIARFGGHIAQYLGDGLLIYFGYPLAHEDDARRAVRAGLGMIEALEQLNRGLTLTPGVRLAARVGVHTGLVVVGEMGGADRRERLALGETPNVAARLQGLATPNAVVVSEATFRLLGGFFICEPLGTPSLKGLSQPMAVYRVVDESRARSRLEAAGAGGLTPLVGRDSDFSRLVGCWTSATDGSGRVVLVSGEAGIGKSRLVEALRERVATESLSWLTPCQCSAYHQNSALYPVIDCLERTALGFEREESAQAKTDKLVAFLGRYDLPLPEVVPLFTDLLSLPPADGYAPLTLSPEAQKAQTLQALLTILLRRAAREPVLFVVEDLHWVDPSTLELLSLLVEQGPTARILALFTFRPDWRPPWSGHAGLTEIALRRLPREEVEKVIRQVARDKKLPSEVVDQIVAKTDGVPLFVEELTRMVLESGLLREGEERYELNGPLPPLAIPTTLHDSLMARLDHLAAVKSLAQLGATLGREFSYQLLQAISPWDAADHAVGTPATRGGRVPVSARDPAGVDLSLQARPDPGRRLSVVAAEDPPATSRAHCPGAAGPVSRGGRSPARTRGPPLHRGGAAGSCRPALATSGRTQQLTFRLLGSRGALQERARGPGAATGKF